ncbi:hypothetical protein [Endozoicomonas atrinae]|uniref:hypothetical protein n=1 Tax=Endozoicomonas atrinae TaxID=1333660 RepID=UPI00082586C6|nr:hypothetical protein [Endozoicomonas atrinae]
MTQLNWSQVPKNKHGFVNYQVISSPPVREIVARAEIIKLKEELNARRQSIDDKDNRNRIRNIEIHFEKIIRLMPDMYNDIARECTH